MEVLITGGRGQLARAFAEMLERKGVEYRAFSRDQLDISDFASVLECVRSYKPRVIINCAAYNLVDRAEDDFPSAFAVNTLGVHNLAVTAREEGIFLIHFSTDYVFDGQKGDLYTEDDLPWPVNKYGLSKWQGELAIKQVAPLHLVFRVSWLFGQGKQNFLAKLLAWADKNEVLRIAYDEFSVPTYVETVSQVAWKAYEKGLTGFYHLVSRGYCSRFEWARYFLALKGIKRKVLPVQAASFNLPAKRPFFSVLNPGKLEKDLDIEMPSWQDEVARFVNTRDSRLRHRVTKNGTGERR